MKVLLTGFGPFADIVENPTSAIVEQMALRDLQGAELTTRIMPVSFARSARAIDALLREGEYDLALLLGVAGKADKFRIEAVGRNQDNARIPDCDGESRQDVPIIPNGEQLMPATLDIDGLLNAMRNEGFEVEVSQDAGAYVCNHIYYSALNTIARDNLKTQCVFLHVPPAEDSFQPPKNCTTVPLDKQIAFVMRALETLIRSN
jgi:pyroglutamyl-peptidase